MSTKAIFSDSGVYAPASVKVWDNLFGSGANATFFSSVFTQSDTEDNSVTIEMTITQVSTQQAIYTLHLSALQYDQTRINTGTNYPYKSATPLPVGTFNPNSNTLIGVTTGVVINDSDAVTRPCRFIFYVDHNGYVYYSQYYEDGTTVTSEWSVGWSSTYHYVPCAWTTGVVNNDSIADILYSDASFLVSLV